MLSIGAITSSAAAVSYYEKDDYYAVNGGEPDAQGQWWGRGAERLGLAGAVDREVFKQILEGKLPNGTVLGTVRERKLKHRPGWDLTFSAPKSVSVAAEVGGDRRILQAHDESVKEALTWLQKNGAAYRQRGFANLLERKGDNLVVALFQHDTSREQDPQLHTHAVVANATQRKDRKWASLHSLPLYEHKMAAGNVYRAALAGRLQQLGYEVERTGYDGRFELAAVPAHVNEAFSQRRAQIERSLEERGLSGAEASAAAALRTRSAKDVVPRNELLPEWRERANTLGFDAVGLAERALRAGDVTPARPAQISRAVAEAIGRLSETEAVFSHADLMRWALAGLMGRADVGQAERAIAAAARERHLVETSLQQRTAAWTTPGAERRENILIDAWQRSVGDVEPAMRLDDAREALANTELNAGQREAAALIVSAADRFIGVVGRSGTGKTFMLGKARDLLEARGFEVRGMAANSEAARQLEQESGIPSGTLHKHLIDASKDFVALGKVGAAKDAELRRRYDKQVWVVDEASQLDGRHARRVAYLTTRLGARVVLVGDTRQLAAIGAGKPFDLLLKAGMKHARMDEIRRQRDSNQLAAVRDVYAGDVARAMQRLAGDTQEISDKEKRLQAIVSAWRCAGAARAETQILTARNADRTLLNDRIRDVLRQEGQLAGETPQEQLFRVFGHRADRLEAEIYKPGDLVRFGRAVRDLDVKSGEYLRVAASDRKTNLVILERDRDGRSERIEWNPRQVAGGARNGVELLRPRPTSVAIGERIQWNRNSHEHGLANGQVLTVVQAQRDKLELRKSDGRTVTIDTSKPTGRHWEHAYATTVYKAQGATASQILVNAEASQQGLFSQRAFLVAISRQRDSLKLFTDNTERFTENVALHLGDKTSANEAAQATRLRLAAEFLERMRDQVFVSVTSRPGIESDRTVPTMRESGTRE